MFLVNALNKLAILMGLTTALLVLVVWAKSGNFIPALFLFCGVCLCDCFHRLANEKRQ